MLYTAKQNSSVADVLGIALRLPWLEMSAATWRILKYLWRGLSSEGLYEVLDYEATLELQDPCGEAGHIHKTEKVRYVQDNILAYQDHAWGDGEILLNYRCSPGVEVDRYTPGQKTYILISLRETKRRGDIDEFHIDYDIKNGFLRDRELWETEIRHRTRQLTLHLIFPADRPPQRLWQIEYLCRRTQEVDLSTKTRLADGRWQITWHTERPHLHERYQLQWEW